MKKTLLVCGRYPLPEDHGSPIRTMNFVRFFLNHGSVDIAYSQISPGMRREESVFSKELFLKKRVLDRRYKNRFHRLLNLRKIPLPLSEFCRDSERALLSLIEMNDYEYILARYLYNTSIFFKLPQKYRLRTIVDFDDVLSGTLYDGMFASVKGLHKKVIVNLNRKLLSAHEKKCLGFGASLFCSDKDRARVVGNGRRRNAFVVPNIYENRSLEGYDFGDGFEKGHILLFVGALGYGPNVHGLKWFIELIFPEFRKRYPGARLLVVGRSPAAEVGKICNDEKGVTLLPDVPDVKEYYKRCRAVVVPLLAGGGTRIKILEAALANRPVLSTPLGAEGLDLAEGKDILLFGNAGEFSAQYGRLLEKNTHHSLVKNARQIVSNRYTVQEFNRAMETVLKWIEDGNQPLPVLEGLRDVSDCITR
jgi:glycosyltransferase involved in cell wall biosynthesis